MPTVRDLDRSAAVDAGLVALALVVQVPLAVIRPDAWPDIGTATPVLAVAAAWALWFRRRHPVPVAIGLSLAAALAPVVAPALFVALYDLGVGARRPVAVATWGCVGLGTTVLQIADDGANGLVRGPVIALAMGFPVALGMAVETRRRLVEELVDRAERAEREQRLRADAAVAAERARLARELHDVVAHRVSLMVLHASALELAPAAAPAVSGAGAGVGGSGSGTTATATDADGRSQAESRSLAEEAALIGRIGRQALDELRQMLDVLRHDGDGGEPPPLAPLPSLTEIHDLVAASRAAGVAVTFEEDGDLGTVPGTVGRTAFRIVQEALTNAHKHAAGAVVDVGVRRRPEEIEVDVVNGRPASTPWPLGAPPDVSPGGHGLLGLRERVALLGGQVAAGPTPDGGWAVRARLPVT